MHEKVRHGRLCYRNGSAPSLEVIVNVIPKWAKRNLEQNIFGASKCEVVGSIPSAACIYMNTYTHMGDNRIVLYLDFALCKQKMNEP